MSDERKTKRWDGATVVSGVSEAGPARVGVARAGMKVGAVVLEEQIGEGGMGVVWRGRHEILERKVAVKFVTEAVEEGDPGFVAFVEGARAAAAVKHAGLVEVFDAGVMVGEAGPAVESIGSVEEGIKAGGTEASSGGKGRGARVPYLVMELVEGVGLDRVVSGGMSLGATLAVMEQVCAAIGELHAAGFVHRDIKPGNILLDADARVKVTDFGLACERAWGHRTHGAMSGGARASAGAHICGTPAYMAPECFAGEVSAKSDVYALAVMMFELLTGEPPFVGELLELKRLHEESEVPRRKLVERGVPEAVVEVIERGMVKSAGLRPRSAMHWLESLRASVRDREVWEGGVRELKLAVSRAAARLGGGGTGGVGGAGGDSTSFYKTIAERAEEKRRVGAATEPAVLTVPMPETARCACGYELKGLLTGGKCPECGRALAASMRPLPCVGCGYDLVGIDERGKCPECGIDVVRSVQPSRLMFADEAWLRRVASGFWMMTVGIVLMPVVMLVAIAISLLVMGASASKAFGTGVGVTFAVGFISASVLLIIGVLNATAKEPAGHGSVAARWTRWCMMSGLAMVIGAGIADWAAPRFPERLLSVPGAHLLAIGVVFLGGFVERLGERIPDRNLIKAGRGVFWPWMFSVVFWYAAGMVDRGWLGVGASQKAGAVQSGVCFVGLIYAATMAASARKRIRAVLKVVSPRPEGGFGRERFALKPGLMAASAGVFSALLVPLFTLLPRAHLWVYEVSQEYGWLESSAATGGVNVEGRVFPGRPWFPIHLLFVTAAVLVLYGVPVVTGLALYLWKAFGRKRSAAGGSEDAEDIVSKESTFLRRLRIQGVSMAAAFALYLIVIGLVVAAAARVLAAAPPDASVRGVALVLLIHVPPFVVAVMVGALVKQRLTGGIVLEGARGS